MSTIKGHLSDHEYDGIREYDNPTPGWWHLIFLATAIFAFFYFVYYDCNPESSTVWKELTRKQAIENKRIFGALGDMEPEQNTILKLIDDPKLMAVGQAQFQSTCAQCHAKDGGGLNGVNLTDDSYKNAKKVEDLFTVISDGAGSGAMPAWKTSLSKNERILMAAYAASLRGTKPANPKAPEGTPSNPWPKATK